MFVATDATRIAEWVIAVNEANGITINEGKYSDCNLKWYSFAWKKWLDVSWLSLIKNNRAERLITIGRDEQLAIDYTFYRYCGPTTKP